MYVHVCTRVISVISRNPSIIHNHPAVPPTVTPLSEASYMLHATTGSETFV